MEEKDEKIKKLVAQKLVNDTYEALAEETNEKNKKLQSQNYEMISELEEKRTKVVQLQKIQEKMEKEFMECRLHLFQEMDDNCIKIMQSKDECEILRINNA